MSEVQQHRLESSEGEMIFLGRHRAGMARHNSLISLEWGLEVIIFDSFHFLFLFFFMVLEWVASNVGLPFLFFFLSPFLYDFATFGGTFWA